MCVNFAVYSTFKVKCSINWHQVVSGCVFRSLKDFCIAKSVLNFNVNIALSKGEFIGVVSFEIIKFVIWKLDFSCVFSRKRGAALQKRNTFRV